MNDLISNGFWCISINNVYYRKQHQKHTLPIRKNGKIINLQCDENVLS